MSILRDEAQRVVLSYLRESGLQLYHQPPKKLFKDLEDRILVFFDTETSGLNHVENQLTQVSAIATKGPDYPELGVFDEKIALNDDTLAKMEHEKLNPPQPSRPGGRVPWTLEKVLQFNHYFEGEPSDRTEEEVLVDFKEFVAGYGRPILVAQNARFDMSFIGRRIGDLPAERVYDTKYIADFLFIPAIKVLAGREIPEEQERLERITKTFPARGDKPEKKRPSSSMEYLMRAFKEETAGLHDALADVRATIKAFRGIMEYFDRYTDVHEDPGFLTEKGKAFQRERERRLSPGKKEYQKSLK